MARAQGTTGQRYNYGVSGIGTDLENFEQANPFGNFITGHEAEEFQWYLDEMARDRANKWNEYMWNKENEYNSTKNQLKRWLEAGGNPNAFFQGGTNTGNASSVTSASPGNIDAPKTLGERLQQTLDTTKTFWENKKTEEEAKHLAIENGTLNEINTATIGKIKQEIANGVAKEKVDKETARQINEMLPHLIGKTDAEIEKINQEKDNLIQEGENLKEQWKYLKQNTREKTAQAYVAEWEAWYRTIYGTNPESSWINLIYQSLTGGKAINAPAEIFEEGWKYIKLGWDVLGDEEYLNLIKEHPEMLQEEYGIGKKEEKK